MASWSVLAAAVAALLAASTSGPVTAAPERAAGYTTYVACSHKKSAPPSHSCAKEARKAAFFVSEDADVVYDICLKVPGSDRKLCARGQAAEQGKKYRNTITSQKLGKHTVTWYVDGQKVDSFSFRVRAG